jgi:CDP-diacylglycerol--glycerol-3-phosphate 3-phosphatidyltransferase
MIWLRNINNYRQIPNLLSLLRAVMGICLPLLMLSHHIQNHIIALFIFIVAAVTDYSDGWYARRYNIVSNFGKIADPTADKVLILSALLAFSHLGFYSIWWIVPIVVREGVITFCRIGWLLENKAVGAEKLGKVKFAFQVVLISLSFIYLLALDFNICHELPIFGYIIIHIALVVAVALTLISGVSFYFANRLNFKSPFFAKFTSSLGVGFFPLAPGTWGSLIGIGFVCLGQLNLILYFTLFCLLLWIGYWSVSQLDLRQDKDPHYVVIDEALGMMAALAWVKISFFSVLTGFLLFRMFDILKPFPLRRLEKLPGYWGILCDDLGAGIYTCLILYYFF